MSKHEVVQLELDSRSGGVERTLLLVDDEPNILSALTRLLRRDGYRILRATSGAEGLELLSQFHVAVIISDQRMPEMTGVEFLSHVKETYPDTVRMVLSGYTELSAVTDAINNGAIYKFLTKPWDDELLRQNVRDAFEYADLRHENERLAQQLKIANDELYLINRDLERRVEEKNREMMLHYQVLKVSQEVLESLPVAVLGLDEDGTVVVANRRAHRVLEAGAGALLGSSAATLFNPELSALYQTFRHTGRAAGPWQGADGQVYRVVIKTIGAREGERNAVLVMQRRDVESDHE